MMQCVLIHGLGGRPSSWDKVVEELSDESDVEALGLPGHGERAALRATDSFGDVAVHLWQELAPGAGQSVHLVGYSLGARVAMAMREERPEAVSRLTLIAGHPGLRDEAERQARRAWDQEWSTRLRDEGIQGFVDAWENLPLFESQRRLASSVRASHRKRRLSHDALGLGWAFDVLGLGNMPSFWSGLQSADLPIDYLVGGLDSKYRAIGQELVGACKSARMRVAPAVGHDLVLEAPDWVAHQIAEPPRHGVRRGC